MKGMTTQTYVTMTPCLRIADMMEIAQSLSMMQSTSMQIPTYIL